MFGIETWGGAPKTQLRKIQQLQDQASKLALTKEHQKLSPRQREQLLGWLSIEKEIARATHLQTYKILTTGSPQEISSQMPTNEKNLRIISHNKLDTRPRWLGATKVTRSTYRNRAYSYNTLPKRLTAQPKIKTFKKDLKTYLSTN